MVEATTHRKRNSTDRSTYTDTYYNAAQVTKYVVSFFRPTTGVPMQVTKLPVARLAGQLFAGPSQECGGFALMLRYAHLNGRRRNNNNNAHLIVRMPFGRARKPSSEHV